MELNLTHCIFRCLGFLPYNLFNVCCFGCLNQAGSKDKHPLNWGDTLLFLRFHLPTTTQPTNVSILLFHARNSWSNVSYLAVRPCSVVQSWWWGTALPIMTTKILTVIRENQLVHLFCNLSSVWFQHFYGQREVRQWWAQCPWLFLIISYRTTHADALQSNTFHECVVPRCAGRGQCWVP